MVKRAVQDEGRFSRLVDFDVAVAEGLIPARGNSLEGFEGRDGD